MAVDEKNKETVAEQFVFATYQQHAVAQHYGKNIEDLEFWEVCELLDDLIDTIS